MGRDIRNRKGSITRLPGEDFEYVEGFGGLIREEREKMGLTQEDLAKQLNEKVTIIRKIEAGEFNPSIELAKKIEKLLKIRILVPAVEEDLEQLSKYVEKGEKQKGVSLELFFKKIDEKGKR